MDIAEFVVGGLAEVGELVGAVAELPGADGDNDRGGLNGNPALLQPALKAKRQSQSVVTLPMTLHRR